MRGKLREVGQAIPGGEENYLNNEGSQARKGRMKTNYPKKTPREGEG